MARLIGTLCLFLLAAIAGACVSDPPKLEDRPPREEEQSAAGPATAAAPAPSPPAADDSEAWQRLAQQLEAENAQLQQELDAARSDAERSRTGLEQAVAELNRLGAVAAAPRPTPPPAGSSGRARVTSIVGPDVQILGDNVRVHGLMYNSGSASSDGLVHVTVFANGRQVGTGDQAMRLDPGGEGRYAIDVYVRTDPSQSHLTATANWRAR
jgi:hypothetical protein